MAKALEKVKSDLILSKENYFFQLSMRKTLQLFLSL